MMPKPLLKGFLMAAALVMLAGCGEKESRPTAEVPAPRKVPASTVKKQAPEVKAPEAEKAPPAYVYEPAGKRDPFEPLLTVRNPLVDPGEPLTPLQQFELGQFKLAGIIVGKAEPMALVLAPGGKSYILKKGVKIGKNAGTVVAIEQDGVQVEEKFYDFSGTYRKSIQKIQLPEREGV